MADKQMTGIPYVKQQPAMTAAPYVNHERSMTSAPVGHCRYCGRQATIAVYQATGAKLLYCYQCYFHGDMVGYCDHETTKDQKLIKELIKEKEKQNE